MLRVDYLKTAYFCCSVRPAKVSKTSAYLRRAKFREAEMNTLKTRNIRERLVAAALAFGTMAFAIPAHASDPACSGGDQGVCDMLGSMIAAKGKGCHRMMSVTPIGNDGWRISCVVSSTSSTRATYTLRFNSDRTSYTLD